MRGLAKGRKHTQETKKSMSINRKGENNSFFNKTHTLFSKTLMKKAALNREGNRPNNPGMEVEITDLLSRSTSVYPSIRSAAKAINSDIKTILRREKAQIVKGVALASTPYRKKYIITINRN